MMKYRGLLAVLLLLFVPGSVFSVNGPTEKYELLDIGVGSRPFGMGGTFAAIADDANAVYWNPAGLGMLKNREFTGMYSQFFNYEYLAYVNPIESFGTFGISGYYYQYLEKPENFSDIWDTALMLSYGKAVNNNTSVGFSAKFLNKTLYEKNDPSNIYNSAISTISRSGFCMDVGVLYKISEELYLAAVVQNLSASVFMSTDAVKDEPWKAQPLNYRIGASLKLFDDIVTLGFDLNLPEGSENFVCFGGEYWILDWVALRMGYNSREGQNQGIHFGVGIGNENIHLDWILVPFKGMEERINRISLSWRFGREYKYTLIEDNIEKHFRKGKRYYYRGELIRAYLEFKNILELVPGHREASDYLARTQVKLDDYDTSKEITGYFEKGEKYYKEGDFVKARFEFDSLLLMDPEHSGAKDYLNKIQVKAEELIAEQMKETGYYYDRGDYEIALEHINKVLSFEPEHKVANEYLALTNEKLNLIKETRKKQQDKLEGKWKAVSDYYKGLALYNMGEWVQAISVFEDVLKYNPEHEGSREYLEKAKMKAAENYYERGLSYFRRGEYDSALREFKTSLKYAPDNRLIYDKLKEIDNKIKESNENIKKENKKKAEKYYAQGLVSYTQGDTEGAIKSWKLAAKMDPENETIQNALKRALEEIKVNE